MFVIGRGRYAREGYPEFGQGGAAAGALRNRNVLAPPASFPAFTPGTAPTVSLVAALLFTPKVSGVVSVTALLGLVNGVTAETYGLIIAVATGTNLSVSGGSSGNNGWVVGSTTPPVIGGVVTGGQAIGESATELAASGQGSVDVSSAISQPVPVGVPVVIEVLLTEVGGGHALSGTQLFSSLSVLELP